MRSLKIENKGNPFLYGILNKMCPASEKYAKS